MRRSAQLAEKNAKVENEFQSEPKAKKKRSNDNTSNIAAMDNGTMVESLKFLNYCQLATSSLVSKRFWNLIRIHRHSLALLYVDRIIMHSTPINPAFIKVFGDVLTYEKYNKWIIRNNYSRQISLDDEVAGVENTQNVPSGYQLNAYACFKGAYNRGQNDVTCVFFACVELNHENWPAFQHFVRLLTDPFIYIYRVQLTDQNDFLNLLVGAINTDHRVKCEKLDLNLNGDCHKFIIWTNNHVRCKQFYIYVEDDLNHDEALLDFFVTGGLCTPAIEVRQHEFSETIADFVQKFTDFKNSDENQFVEAIEGTFNRQVIVAKLLNRDYAKLIVKERSEQRSKMYIFEFVNNNIGKKLQIAIRKYSFDSSSEFSIKITNL